MSSGPLSGTNGFSSTRRKRMLLWGGIAVCVAAAAAVRAVFLFADSFATGYDGYYYALQVKSLIENGEVLNNDNSIIYPLLRFFAFFYNDVVVTNKIAAIVLCSLVTIPFYLTSYRLTSSHIFSFSASLFFVLSFSQIYMSFEILKNGVSILFALSCLYCLCRFFDAHPYKIVAPVCFILGFLTHKATAACLIVFTLVYFGVLLFLNRTSLRGRKRLAVIIAAAGTAGVIVTVILLSFTPLRLIDLGNLLNQLSLDSVFSRFGRFATQVADVRIKGELFLLYVIPLVFIPFFIRIVRDRSVRPRRRAFFIASYVTQWVLLNPFLLFSWDSTSYRLVLMSVIFSSLEIAVMLSMIPVLAKKVFRFPVAGIWLVLIGITLPGMYTRFHTDRYPPYRSLKAAMFALKDRLPSGSKLVCQPGLSFFVWYTTGLYTQHFLPEDEAGYYRLAYGIGPYHFQQYKDMEGYEEPATVKLPYVLVKESLWRRFYADYSSRLKILADWHNPYKKRPPFVYKVKKKYGG